ncbi:MAG TPA: hypothetical protein VN670_00870 [Acidobacteriaceae bacterium]|nr:hypothetical protein [Acidobacteriaceae bacterium]
MTFPASLAQALNNFQLPSYPSFTGLPQPIAIRSVVYFLGALAWASLLLVSFTGWGRAAGKLLRIPRLPASAACAVGIAVIIFWGGWLNSIHAIYSSVLYVLTGIGLLLYFLLLKERPEAYRWKKFWGSASGWSQAIITITLLILVLRVAATVRLGDFRVEDDGSAYLVFPQKMLATHSFAADPFSDRRVISSIGGSYLLQSFVINATSLAHIGMADRTLGLALMFLALLDLGVAFGLSPPQIAALEFIAYLAPQETFNLTFSILPIALFLSMIWAIYVSLEQSESERWRYAVLVGAVGGAIIALKSTYLPYVGTLAFLPYGFTCWRTKRPHAWSLPLVAGLAAFAIMAAWMFAMKQDSGTFLFPVLGHGVDYSSYGLFHAMPKFSSNRALLRVFLQGVVLLILAGVQYLSGIQDTRSRLSFSVLIAAAVAITAFNYESGADYIWRYNFPQFFTAILVFFAAEASVYCKGSATRRIQTGYAVALLSLIGCIFYYDFEGGHIQPFQRMKIEASLYPGNLRASLSGMQLVSPADLLRYRAVEAALPPGAVALDATTDSFLLTGRDKRKILLDDWPGAASPPPGWPFTHNPEAVATFLAKNSVRYIVYDYDYANWFDMRSCQAIPHLEHFSEVDHALQILNLLTHHQFDLIRAMHQPIYDDGHIVVIDLQSPIVPNSSQKAWTLDTNEDQMCLQVFSKYMTAHPLDTHTKQLTYK